jgi:hypothetical protein
MIRLAAPATKVNQLKRQVLVQFAPEDSYQGIA